MKLYLASSWKNPMQPWLVNELRKQGFHVYDFKRPRPDHVGFSWWNMPDYQNADRLWDAAALTHALSTTTARRGFDFDFQAMHHSDACILVLPCGRSAHLEAGWFVGQRKPVIIYMPQGYKQEPELMYLMIDRIVDSLDALTDHLQQLHVTLTTQGAL